MGYYIIYLFLDKERVGLIAEGKHINYSGFYIGEPVTVGKTVKRLEKINNGKR